MLQWADTFNRYGTNVAFLLNGLYAETNAATIVADPDTSSSQKVLRHSAINFVGTGYRYAFPSGAKATMGFATRLWLAALPTNAASLPGWEFRDDSNTAQVSVRINTTGAISILRGIVNGGTVLGTTAGPVLVANAYNHVEVKATINGATGTVEVRVNGVSVLTVAGVNTQSTALASTSQMAWWATTDSGVTSYHKDYIVWDTTGTYNNNFLGSVSVLDIDTVSDVALTWTPSTGATGWPILDNNPPLDDAAYISAAAVLSNTFGLGDLPADTTSVRGLILLNRSRKIDGGDGNVQMGIISGASTGLGTDRPITTAYTYWRDVIEVDPATALPFTPSGFNASNFKLARTL